MKYAHQKERCVFTCVYEGAGGGGGGGARNLPGSLGGACLEKFGNHCSMPYSFSSGNYSQQIFLY